MKASPNQRSLSTIAVAGIFTVAILALGYFAFGFWTMLIFASGFFVGLVFWLFIKSNTPYREIKNLFWATMLLFLLHRIEEKQFGFFAFLSQVTGVPTPEITSWSVIGLVLLSVGGWLSIPYFFKRGNEIGYYLAWTFFCAMGITELAHWVVFPFLTNQPFAYIPGMATVVILAPVSWIGLWRLWRKRVYPHSKLHFKKHL